jgi:hypothetical protein
MAIEITPAQRNSLREQIFVKLSGIDGVWLVAAAKDYETAADLGLLYSDYLRLMHDLGWEPESSEGVELTAPVDVLRRSALNLRDEANDERELEAGEWTELRKVEGHRERVAEAANVILSVVGGND